jgi:hypothetical protein
MEAHRVVRRRGSHIIQTVGSQMAVSLSALRAGRPLPSRKIPGIHLCWRLSRTQGHSAAGKSRSIEKIQLIWTRTHDLPTCSIVPQQIRYRVPPNVSCKYEY